MEVAVVMELFGVCWIILLHISYSKRNDTYNCPIEDDADRCCTGARMINNTCEICVGFLGENCETPCPPSFYGPACNKKCQCTEEQDCNAFVGCLPVLFTHKNISLQDGSPSSTDSRRLRRRTCGYISMEAVIALAGIQIVLLVLCAVVICIKCCRTSPQRENREEKSNGPCSMDMGTSESLVEQNVTSSHHSNFNLRTRENSTMHHKRFDLIDKEILSSPLDVYDTTISASRMQRKF